MAPCWCNEKWLDGTLAVWRARLGATSSTLGNRGGAHTHIYTYTQYMNAHDRYIHISYATTTRNAHSNNWLFCALQLKKTTTPTIPLPPMPYVKSKGDMFTPTIQCEVPYRIRRTQYMYRSVSHSEHTYLYMYDNFAHVMIALRECDGQSVRKWFSASVVCVPVKMIMVVLTSCL